eukprot:c6733_g1_i1 orf=62-385(+)
MSMGWRRARRALACVRIPLDRDDDDLHNDSNPITETESQATNISVSNQSAVSIPPRSPSRFQLIRSSIRFSRVSPFSPIWYSCTKAVQLLAFQLFLAAQTSKTLSTI